MQKRIEKVSGPLVVASGMEDEKLYDVVHIGKNNLIGEIIELKNGKASIEVYEETSGLKVGDEVKSTGNPLSVELAPGLISNVFDGIGRSLTDMYNQNGDRITVGQNATHLDHNKKWKFVATKQKGDEVEAGDILGYVKETSIVTHKILVPYGVAGTIENISNGEFTIDETICQVKTKNEIKDLKMLSIWPVRKGRPYAKKLSISEPLVTGQRVIDTFFPIAKGGVAAVPGPFGSGKTVVQHQLAKWSEAEIVVYIGCGERGNEMTDVLNEFPKLKDPKTGKMLMERTVLIANTSDMPVAAREASIYTGITIAEYFRDMGYNVVIMADSTSRWAEALRELSGRLEEMPGEEGYPAYLGSRLAEFYERAGKTQVLGKDNRIGSVTAIGAVSPQGGDLSEPVAQATLRIVKVFWGLSSALAYKRHFPAIDWLISYSGYNNKINKWYKDNISEDFVNQKAFAMKTLQEEAELNEVVQLIGFDVLSNKDKVTLLVAQMIREDYLHQNAFDDIDTYTSLNKQQKMLNLICEFASLAQSAVKDGVGYEDIVNLKSRAEIGRAKYIDESDLTKFTRILDMERSEFKNLNAKGE